MKRAAQALDPNLPGRGGHRLHRRDDRRRRDARGHQHPALPAAHHRRGPVAERRPRADLAVDASSARRRCRSRATRAEGEQARASTSSGRCYGMFNMPSDLAEIRRLVEGIGAEVNLVFPLGSHLPTCRKLADAEVNVCHVPRVRPPALRDAGAALSAGADRPAQHHHASCARWANSLGLDPEPFIEREKHTTIKPLWDLWRSVTQDFFGTASFAHRRQRDLRPRRARTSSKTTWACPAPSPSPRAPAPRPTMTPCARRCRRDAAARRLRLLQRAHVPGRGGRPGDVHPGLLPRHRHPPPHRHALHGLLRRDLPGAGGLQRAVRRAVPHPAAGPELDKVEATPARLHRELPWDEDAERALDALVEAQPVLVRISAAKRLRDAAEADAQAGGARSRVSAARFATSAGTPVRMNFSARRQAGLA